MLLTISPAPTSSTSDSATSVTTSAARRRRRPAPSEAVRAPSFNPSFTSVPTPYAAGARPSRIPVTVVTARVNSSTAGSTRMPSARGSTRWLTRLSASADRYAMPSATAPPTNASRRLSTRNCRISLARDAPSATRTAISRCRTAARASSRFARLAQVISRTHATAPSSTNMARRTSLPTTRSRNGTTSIAVPWLTDCSAMIPFRIAFRSPDAC